MKKTHKNITRITDRFKELGDDTFAQLVNDTDKNLMKYALHPESNLGINANTLIHGTTCRSCQYRCIFCSNPVSFVFYQKVPHFRHEIDHSCLKGLLREELIQKKELYETFRANEENKNCTFHQDWQSKFDDTHLEKRITKFPKTHVADIFISSQNSEFITLVDIDGNRLISNFKTQLVIEIQHSYINAYDAINRQDFYVENDQDLLWIFDITEIEHRIERVQTMSSNYIRIVFPRTQLKGISSLIENKKDKANILLDNGGPYLFHLNNLLSCDVDTLKVCLLHRNKFLEQLQKYCTIKSLFPIDNKTIHFEYDNNYKKIIQNIPKKYQHDIDEIFNMLEDISYSEFILLFNNVKCDFGSIKTTIEMITTWISIIRYYTLPHELEEETFECFYKWVKHIRKTQLYYMDDNSFDDLPDNKSIGFTDEIKASEYNSLHNFFRGNNKIRHINTIRRIYEIKYDQSHRKTKIEPFRSAQEDGNNYYTYQIDSLIFDHIDMHDIKYDIFHLNHDTQVLSKKWLVENAFLTCELIKKETYVQKLRDERERKKMVYENLKHKVLSKKK